MRIIDTLPTKIKMGMFCLDLELYISTSAEKLKKRYSRILT
jgi:hypothetical protein